jgi:hypothetical protein
MGRRIKTLAAIASSLVALFGTGSALAEDVCASLTSPSPNLTLINQVGNAAGTTILDHDATRILVASGAGVSIKSRVDGTTTLISAPLQAATYGRLLADGAIWDTGRWRGGVLSANGASAVSGDWALTAGPSVENLATGVLTPVNRPAGSVKDVFQSESLDVSGLDGTLAFGGFVQANPPGSYFVHTVTTAGVATQVDVGIFPLLDGSNVAYTRHGGAVAWPGSLVRTTNGIETLSNASINFLAPATGGPRPHFDYEVRGGWVAYTKLVGTTLEAWTRAPDGTHAKASTLSYVRLAGLNDAGEIVVDHHDQPTRAFLERSISSAAAGGPTAPLSLGGGRGEMRWVDGAWYEYIGCALFKVGASDVDPMSGIPVAGGDAGADAGSLDAGDDGGDGGDGGDGDASASGPDAGAASSGGSTTSSASSSGAASSSGGGASSGSEPASGGTSSGVENGEVGGSGCNVGSPSTNCALAFAVGLGLVIASRRRRRDGNRMDS